jgi:putative pyoverdin transport system ATP-binding/permease protein
MELIRFLLKTSSRMTVMTGLMSLLSGGFNGALVAVVHRTLTTAEANIPLYLILAFAMVGVGKLVTGYFSEVMLTRRAQQAVASLRLDLVRKLQRVPFQNFEHMGQARVLATLTDDVAMLSQAFYVLPSFAINVAVVLGGAAYLVYLSPYALLLLGAFTAVGAVVYRSVIGRAHKMFSLARDERDRLQGHFVSLTQGMKELKLHRPRRRAYTEVEVSKSTDALMDLDVQSHSRYILAHITTHFFLYVLIGIVIFILPAALHMTQATVSGYVLTALYLMGPLSGVVRSLPMFSRAQISLKRVQRLGISLDRQATENTEREETPPKTFECIEVKQAICRYRLLDEADRFVLGPVDLSIRPGEIVFITGGNGSGKSTLAKMLTGLYEPDEGGIHLDGVPVTDENRDQYRQLFTAVFSDFFLFETLLGLDAPDLDERAARYLNTLDLDRKVQVKAGGLSTTRLSQGQRKRLALLTAYLEDRPIYLFDEWAADQDPSFKDIFYRHLIHELKADGKAVVVITHDDRYFDAADRRFGMRDGMLFPLEK